MFRNYLVIALRNLIRQKMYSFINILGLSVGLVCCMLILRYVNYEYQYDQHHSNIDRLYKVLLKKHSLSGEYVVVPGTAGKLASTLQAEYPEVELGLRTFVRSMWVHNEQVAYQQLVCIADPHIMDMFSYPLVAGDPQGLYIKYGAFITSSLAKKIFGAENPLGKRLKTDYKWGLQGEYTVVGILEDMSETSTADLRFDMVTSTVPPESRFQEKEWTSWLSAIKTYVMLKPNAEAKVLEAKLPSILEKYWPDEVAKSRTYYLQPVSRIHLYSRADYGLTGISYGDGTRTNTFLLIAGFILLIACISFMNLTTAQSMHRAQEVGLRKVVGAFRRQLMGQFLGESILLVFIALIVALGMEALTLPYLSALLKQDLAAIEMDLWIPIVLTITILAGFLSGSYPAFYLSKFHPIDILKSASASTGKKLMRQILVVFQFAIAIVLLIGTTVAYKQTAYIENKDLGFNTERLIMVPIFFADPSLNARYETVKQAFLQHPNILKASATWKPGARIALGDVGPVKSVRGNVEIQAAHFYADHDFLDTFNIPLVSGRNITSDEPNWAEWTELLLNETAVRMLGLENPIGAEVEIWGGTWAVVGAVKDFHSQTLREPIGPVVIFKHFKYTQLNLKLGTGDIEETLSFLKTQWRHFAPNRSFSFQFVDDYIQSSYQKELQMRKFLSIFTLLAIFVSCLGVLGLAAFAAEQRIKEIGIRKILGASTTQIVLILSKELFVLVALSNLIAWPIAYWGLKQWLQNFVYHTNLSLWMFILSGVLISLIAGSISGYHAIKAAHSNPVDTLRYE